MHVYGKAGDIGNTMFLFLGPARAKSSVRRGATEEEALRDCAICANFMHKGRAILRSRQLSGMTDLVQLTEILNA